MQFRPERRAFLKGGGTLLLCHGLRNVLYSTAVVKTLSGTISLASSHNSTDAPVTIDSLSVTVDSILVIISDEGFPPELLDSDGDGLNDWDEVTRYGTDYLNSDTDGDGLSDGEEVTIYRTQPLMPDTDGDGYTDGREVSMATNPRNRNSFPVNDGDLNLDGQVNAADSLLATRIIHGDITATSEQLQHGDVAPLVNGYPSPDGEISTGDLVVIMRKALGLVNF